MNIRILALCFTLLFLLPLHIFSNEANAEDEYTTESVSGRSDVDEGTAQYNARSEREIAADTLKNDPDNSSLRIQAGVDFCDEQLDLAGIDFDKQIKLGDLYNLSPIDYVEFTLDDIYTAIANSPVETEIALGAIVVQIDHDYVNADGDNEPAIVFWQKESDVITNKKTTNYPIGITE